MSQMNFIGADGRSIGISLKALATSWGIYQHPDAPREEGLEGIRFHGKGAWRWSRFRRQLDFALNEGTTSPLRLLSYSLFLPRTVVGELRDLCTQHILTTGPNGEQTLNQAAELFAWKEIVEPSSDVVDTTEFLAKVKEAYSRWTTKCAELCAKAEAMMDKLECSEEASHPIVLLRRWTSLYRKAGRLDFSRIVEEEVYLAGKLSGAKGLQIDWSFRAALYEFILQQCPRAKMSDSGYGALIATVKADCKTPQELLSRLQTQALNNGEQSIDGYLGLITPEDNGRKRGPKVYDTDSGRPPKRQKFSNGLPSGQMSTRTNTTTRAHDSFKLPSAELTERQRNGLCFKCGQKGHLAKNCPKTTSTRSGNKSSKDDDSTVKSIHITSASSAYSISVESVNGSGVGINPKRVSNALSIVAGVVSQNVGDHQYTPVRVGIDSMSSVNLISDQIVEEASLLTSPLSQSLIVKGLNGEVELGDSCEVYLTLRGYSAQIQCMVCSRTHLPASIDVLVGRPSFPKLHIQLSIPGGSVDRGAPNDQLGIHRSLSSMKQAAELALMSCMDSDLPLPGAPEYIGRIRKIQLDDVKDHPNQKLVYEVHWTQSRMDSQKLRPSQPAKLKVYDYSVPLLQRLTEGQQQQFRKEIEDYKSHHWWEEVGDHTKGDKKSIGTACTFPVAQSIFKTTKCRPCTDCREINKYLPRASYDGFTIFEATALVRGRWNSSYTLAFLDLSKAFYRLRLGDEKYVHIVTDSHRYCSNRVVFGLVFGPAALSGLVLAVLNAAFTGLLGRPVMCKSTREFTNLVPNLFCVVYYDDVMIWGDGELVAKLANILTQIAPIVGSEFPPTKQDWLRPFGGNTDKSGYRHLGSIWSRTEGEDGGLRLECVAPSSEEIKVTNQVTRRGLFRTAGMLHDPMRLHPMTRFIADRIRRWGGSSEGGNTPEAWNHKWAIDPKTQAHLTQMIELAFKDGYGSCYHTPINNTDKIIGYCDASETGWGLLLYASSTQKAQKEKTALFGDSNMLEAHCGEWDDKSKKYHINRREAITLQRTICKIADWLKIFLPGRIKEVTIYCDNSTAVSWSTTKSMVGVSRSYDRVALERLINAIHDVKDLVKDEYGIDIVIEHIKGLHNTFADELSRASSSALPLQKLSKGLDNHKSRARLCKGNKRNKGAIVLAMIDSGECTIINDKGSSHRGVLGVVSSPADCIGLPPKESSVTLGVSVTDGEEPEEDPYEELAGIGSLTKDDIFDHIREALADEKFTKDHSVIPGVTYFELLAALRNDGKVKPTIKAQALALGSPNGPYYRIEDSLLWVNDPQERTQNSDYRIVLPTVRSQKWALYRAHDSPLASHRGTRRAVEWMRGDTPGFWWPNQVFDTNRHIRTCQICQLNKFHDVQNHQPVVRRRWQSRFETLQIDWAGPILPEKQDDVHPVLMKDAPAYLCVIICEGTHMLLAVPTPSASARCLVYALTTWISLYGPPAYIQLDNAGGHKNVEYLEPFLRYWGIEAKYGLPRHPQSQGLVERAIRDLKTAIRIGSARTNTGQATVPWWLSVQIAVLAHNTSMISEIVPYTPMELTIGSMSRTDKALLRSDTPSDAMWTAVTEQLADLYAFAQLAQAEKAMIAEMRSIVDVIPRHRFKVGDQVKLSRLVDNKRQVMGPYRVQRISDTNHLIYYLEGRKDPVPLSHLLPFIDASGREQYEDAIKPAVDQLAYAAKGKAPWGDEITSATNKHWLIGEPPFIHCRFIHCRFRPRLFRPW